MSPETITLGALLIWALVISVVFVRPAVKRRLEHRAELKAIERRRAELDALEHAYSLPPVDDSRRAH